MGLALLASLAGLLGAPAAQAQVELFVVNETTNAVTVYERTAAGNTAPVRTLSLGSINPSGLAVDRPHDELLVAGGINHSLVNVYTRTASGNAAPIRTIEGPATGLNFPRGLALDSLADELFATNTDGASSSVTVHDRAASGNATPLRTLQGAATALNFPLGATVDLTNNELIVANSAAPLRHHRLRPHGER